MSSHRFQPTPGALPLSSALLACCVVFAIATSAQGEDAAEKVTYADHVQPIFRQHCFACHGPDTKKNDLSLESYVSTMTGGASGEVLYAEDLTSSQLWLMVSHEISPAMPPGGAKLSDAELQTIQKWIEGGLLEKGDSQKRAPKKNAVAAFTPTADNRPEGEPAMPQGLSREPVIHAEHRGAATSLAASPWAPVAAVGAPFQISLYNTDSGEHLGVLPFIEGTPYVLQFSRDGSMLLAAGGKSAAVGMAALYDVKTGRRLTTVGDELDAVLAADLRADHALIAIGGPRKVVRVYRVADGSLAYEITKHTDWVTALEFSPDGKFLASADRSGGLLIWDAETGRERGDLRGHTEQITSLSWRGDSAVLASASEDDTARLWQLDGQQIKSWGAQGGGVASVRFARTGELTTTGRDQLVRLWNAEGGHIRDLATLEDLGLAARFTHDGARVVASDWRGNVRVLDTATGAQVAIIDPNPPTVAARLAAIEAEVAQVRVESQAADQGLVAAQEQVAAAELALANARAAAESQAKVQADKVAQLAAAEQRLAAIAAEKASLEQSAVVTIEQLGAAKQELVAVESGAVAARAKLEEAQSVVVKQQGVVAETAAQLETIQKSLAEAQAVLKSLTDALAAQDQGAAEAQGRVAEIQGKIEELERQTAELEAIQKLREEHRQTK
ncbi:c-type cytochrome domain-containing protein [Lacipirellula limnantheis]|uniref:Chromosome partition protein Smc n=1 Tax=Lacipirellula limnantheis TaxID=2528024 RepID=A0A517TXC1_9BACT|nr:c-type cytochrome domain-containing protein [Lacipirellula limnantheis]QDT73019.1 Chromosome partition protein Smc [Lacipirellula limnantheis]